MNDLVESPRTEMLHHFFETDEGETPTLLNLVLFSLSSFPLAQ